MFYFGILKPELAENLLVPYQFGLAAALVALVVSIAYFARDNRFRWCVLLTSLGLIAAHVLGVADVVSFCYLHWLYIVAGLIVWLALCYPYARFVEWQRMLPGLYEERAKREEEEKQLAIQRAERVWFESKLAELGPERFRAVQHTELRKQWAAHLKSDAFGKELEDQLTELGYRKPILASRYMSTIVGIMMWWPFKLFYRIVIQWIVEFAKRVREFFQLVYKKLAHKFQEDSDREFERQQALRAAEKV